MANFKRRKPKRARAGCKLCKPHKQNGPGGDALSPNVKRKLQGDDWKRVEGAGVD